MRYRPTRHAVMAAALVFTLSATPYSARLRVIPSSGVASFEDGTSTSPVGVWYAPGTVTNVAGGHRGSRAVAVTGNIRIAFDPSVDQTRFVWWMKSSAPTHISGLIQYYTASWQSLGDVNVHYAADGEWREQVLPLDKPAGAVHVYATMWVPAGITLTLDDVAAVGDNPTGLIESFETAGSGTWSEWYDVASVQNVDTVSHSGFRSLAISGNVKFLVTPIVVQTSFWHRRACGAAPMSFLVQYFNESWALISETSLGSVVSDTTWQEATLFIDAPANTRYVQVGAWPGGSGCGASVNIDDFATVVSIDPAQRPFNTLSPWNSLVSLRPYTFQAHPELTSLHWWVNLESFSIPVVNSTSGDPLVTISIPVGWGRPATTLQLRIPAGVGGSNDTDGHLVVNDEFGISYNFYNFDRTSTTTATASSYGSTPLDGDGFIDPATGLNAGTRASAASPMGGLLYGPEIGAGEIEHALAVSLPNSMLRIGWVPPVHGQDNNGPSVYYGSIPMGSRLVVPPSASMPSGLSPLGQKIWRAAKKYGMFVVDRADTPTLYADPRSMTAAQISALRVYWCSTCGGKNDLDRIAAQLVRAIY
jgi:hypothetical protein